MTRFIRISLLLATILFGYSAIADNAFDVWKAEFRKTAMQQGISAVTLDAALIGLQPNRKVLKLDGLQPEFTRPIWEYIDNATSQDRLNTGSLRLQQYSALLDQISQRYRVDKYILLAIWGMESNFGRHMGNYSVIRALASLAYAGREQRREFWREQLLAALRLVDQGDVNMGDLRGSWAGAIGHTQFIPSTYEQYAVDFDGDGKRDLRNSIADALASTANYLQQSGWQPDRPWGEEVTLPPGFDWKQADPGIVKTANNWLLQNKVLTTTGGIPAGGGNELGYVYLPAGYRGPAFLLYENFHVILEYNRANSYALAVAYLADLLKGKPAISAQWPIKDTTLSYNQKGELQTLLSAVGYSTEGIDGLIGPNTRSALRKWQEAVGFPPDGYATFDQLELLRGQAEIKTGSFFQGQ